MSDLKTFSRENPQAAPDLLTGMSNDLVPKICQINIVSKQVEKLWWTKGWETLIFMMHICYHIVNWIDCFFIEDWIWMFCRFNFACSVQARCFSTEFGPARFWPSQKIFRTKENILYEYLLMEKFCYESPVSAAKFLGSADNRSYFSTK